MQCRLLHDWGPWGWYKTERLLHWDKDVGLAVFQKRKCYRCAFVKMRVEKVSV